jgi:hypothetical protein
MRNEMAGKKKGKKPAAPARKKKQKRILDPDKYEPTQVAVAIGCPYQRARNMMLGGAFGDAVYEGSPPKLRVLKSGVDAFIAKRDARK